MSKALIMTGNLVQDHEFIYPYYRLKEAWYDITVATKDGKEAKGYFGTKVPPDNGCEVVSWDDTTEEGFDLLLIPGGAKCMEYMRQSFHLMEVIGEFYKQNKTIASICHGAQMLISAKVVPGRFISGYYSIKDDIENAGAVYSDSAAVVSDNIITCPHYKYIGEWMRRVIGAGNEDSDN